MSIKPTTGNEQKTIFELSSAGRRGMRYPKCDVPETELPAGLVRNELPMPELSEADVVRHFTNLSELNYSLDNGFYPLGSCTMKYNPKIDEKLSRLDGFVNVHPLQPIETVQGSLLLMYELQDMLQRVSGMDACTLTPAAGAHGEFSGVKTIAAWHQAMGHDKRKVMLIPDSAHGTNPATSAMSGLVVKPVPTDERGNIDLEKLAPLCNDELAGIMITNPNTLGLFDEHIEQVNEMVHKAGGLVYGDGANMNALLGIARPGDLGFDVMHFNLHKTFATPHGGGGPGSGPICAKKFLADFIPGPVACILEEETDELPPLYGLKMPDESMGQVRSFWGHFGVMVKAYVYILMLGEEGLRRVSEFATLNANYMMEALKKVYHLPFDRPCMHEFVLEGKLPNAPEVHALDIAKRLMDYKFHPPTNYFPLIVHEALMIEPTESENKQTLDAFIEAMLSIAKEAEEDPQLLHDAPLTTPFGRMDEVKAAKDLILTA